MNVGIVGLGLIGGSMAKSTKTRTAHTVWATDLDAETMMLARLSGAVDAPLSIEKLCECDLILVAVRPHAAMDWVSAHAGEIPKTAVLVDLCGVKRSVCALIAPIAEKNGFSFIGGHPMAGRERGGFVNSSADLFSGASMILTPGARTDVCILEMLKAFFTDIGFASLTFSTPEEHDRRIAYTSQLAHVVSSAYVKSPESLYRRGFSAGSFKDMTRVAHLDEAMWTELFLENADYLSEQLGILIGHLNEYSEALEARDAERLCALLRDGREKKAAAGGN